MNKVLAVTAVLFICALITQSNAADEFSKEQAAAIKKTGEKHVFQTEVSKLMGILINSLYTNREVFLRELISNGSDALDKIRFLSLTNPKLLGEGETAKLDIKIRFNEKDKILTITDKGIGMTKSELEKNLGTIAHSGTTEFMKQTTHSKEEASNFIGQFGVGFYSAFLVADRVTVISTSYNDTEQWIWESDANSEYTITKDPRGNTLGRGTKIILHLKDDALDMMKQDSLKAIIKKYSEFIDFPIYIWASHEEEVPAEEKPEDKKQEEKKNEATTKDEKKEEEKEKKEKKEKEKKDADKKEEPKNESTVEEDEDEDEEEEETDSKKEKPKTIKKTVFDWEQVNTVKPIWSRSPKDVTEEEYNAFYKALTKSNDKPLLRAHFTAEGEADFKALIYIPEKPPVASWDPSPEKQKMSLRLYVKRVFITSDFYDILPAYLRFLRGVVDSDDFPLNVSREHLQESRILKVIKTKIVKKTLAMLTDYMKDKREEYQKFFNEYQGFLKLGVTEDDSNRDKIAKLLLFPSSHNETHYTSFEEYVSRMKPNQKDIYYVAGESLDFLKTAPFTERLRAEGYEILYLTKPADQYAVMRIGSFQGKYKLVNLAKDGVKIQGIDEEKEKKANEEAKKTAEAMKKILGDKVVRVVVSTKLTKTPAALVAQQFGYDASMEKVLRNQPLGSNELKNLEFMTRQVMEINPGHPIIAELTKKIALAEKPEEDKEIVRTAKLLYQTSLVNSGYSVANPNEFATSVYELLSRKLGIDPSAKTVEVDLKEAPKKDEETKKDKKEESKNDEKKEANSQKAPKEEL